MSGTVRDFQKLAAPKAKGGNGEVTVAELVEAACAWGEGSPYGDTPQRLERLAALMIQRGEMGHAARLAEVIPVYRAAPGRERAMKALIWAQLAAAGEGDARARAAELLEALEVDRAAGQLRGVDGDALAAARLFLDEPEAMEAALEETVGRGEGVERAVMALLERGRIEDAERWFLRQIDGQITTSRDQEGALIGALVEAGEYARAVAALERCRSITLSLGAASGALAKQDLEVLESFAMSPEARSVIARALLDGGRAEDAVALYERGESEPRRTLAFALDAGVQPVVERTLKEVAPGEKPEYLATLRYRAGVIELEEALATIEGSAGEHATSRVDALAGLLAAVSARGDRPGVDQVIRSIEAAWAGGLSSFDKGREAACRGAELAARAAAYLTFEEPKAALKALREARAAASKASGTSKKVSALQAVARAEIAMGRPEEAYKTAKKLPKNDRPLMGEAVVRGFLPEDPAGALLSLGLNEVPATRLRTLVEIAEAL